MRRFIVGAMITAAGWASPRAAGLLDLAATRGTLRPGSAADLVATSDSPLDDPTALKRISFVMKDGHVIRHDPGRRVQ